jgi:hypothetical protein
MATNENEKQKREVPASLESIADSVTTVRKIAAGLYDHVNTLLEQTSEIYDVISDRAAAQAAGYGAHYADYFGNEAE